MRIWDMPPNHLCRKHLLGEHRELHALWKILVEDKKGYRKHPETKRWEGKLKALYKRHDKEVAEMYRRNYTHKSDLDKRFAVGKEEQDVFVNSLEEQKELLKNKNCDCYK